MAPKRARKSDHEHEWTDFEKHTLLCLMAKGEHLAPRGKRTDDPSKLRQHAYLEVATNLNFACHGNKYDEDIDKRDVAKMIDQLMIEKKAVLGYGGYMERSTAGRITRGLKRMTQKNTKLDYDGSLSEWNNGRKAKEAEKLRIANSGAPRDDTESLFYEDEEDGGTGASNRDGRPRGDLWAQADVAATTSRAKWRGAQADLRPSIEIDDHAGPRASPVVDNGHDSFRQLPPSLRRNEKFQWAAGAANLPPKPTASAPGRGDTSSRGNNDHTRDTSAISSLIRNPDSGQASRPASTAKPASYSNSSSAIPSYERQVDYPQGPSTRPTGGFADTRLNLPPKPPKPAKETRKVGFALPDDGGNIFSKPSKSPPKKSTDPARLPTMPLNRASSRDARLAYSLNAEVSPATNVQPRWPELPAKPGLLQEAINPARRALMETTNREPSDNDDAETHTVRGGRKFTSSNKEALPFNRLDKARSASTGSRD